MTKILAPMLRAAALTSVVTIAACASGEPPNAQLAASRTAISDAERAGAAERAPVELNSARTKLDRAQDAARRDRFEEAARLAREAEIDAQLASAKAQSSEAQAALTQVRQGINTLQQELQRQQLQQNELQRTTPR